MDDPAVLVIGGGPRGWAAALALAGAGVDVTLLDVPLIDRPAAAAGVPLDVRADTALLGFESVDHHVEAELSDGRIENVDVILAAGERMRVLADPERLWPTRLRGLVEAV